MQENYEQRLSEQRKKYDSLWKMHRSILDENDQLTAILIRLRIAMNKEGDDESITIEQANALVDEAIKTIDNRESKKCECERWKKLYVSESEESVRLSTLNDELLRQLKEKAIMAQANMVEVNRLMVDYLSLFKKQFESGCESATKDNKDRRRSKSKGKTGLTDKKIKQDSNVRVLMDQMERDLKRLYDQVISLRENVSEKERLIRIYRQKERRYMLNNDYSDCLS